MKFGKTKIHLTKEVSAAVADVFAIRLPTSDWPSVCHIIYLFRYYFILLFQAAGEGVAGEQEGESMEAEES